MNQQNRREGKPAVCSESRYYFIFINCFCWQTTLASQLMDSIKHQSWLKYLSLDIALVNCVDILWGWRNYLMNFLWDV